MGLFTNYKNIGLINERLEIIEGLIKSINRSIIEEEYRKNILEERIANVARLSVEIINIAESSGNSVKLAPYWYNGEKKSLMDIMQIIKQQHNHLYVTIKSL